MSSYFIATLLVKIFLGSSAAHAGVPSTHLLNQVEELKSHPTETAMDRLRVYFEQSDSSSMQQGFEMLLATGLSAEASQVRRASRRIRIDGKVKDWIATRVPVYHDPERDLRPIDDTKPMAPYRAHDDIKRVAVLPAEASILFMIELVKAPPRGKKFYYALNILTHESHLLYTLSWTESGFYVQKFNPTTNEWVSAQREPRSTESAAKAVFEGKVPRRLLPTLPEHYFVEAVSWDPAANCYDSLYYRTPQSRPSERYYNYALELLAQYAEQIELRPNDPLPLAQAVVDAHIYRYGTEQTRREVVDDGIRSFDDVMQASAYSFPGQRSLRDLEFPELLVWANRAIYYSVNGPMWKLRKSFTESGGFITPEMYRYLFVTPDTMRVARRIISDQSLLVPSDLSETLRKFETYLQLHWKYRADKPFIEKLYQLLPDVYKDLYDEVMYEFEQGLAVVATVGSDEILKYWNQSASFQLLYLLEYGLFYGNCGDSASMGVAMGKAIGVPAIHVHYDAVTDSGYQQAVHSFPAYYDSAGDRYIGYSAGNNQLFAHMKSGTGADKVFYFNDVPIVSPAWSLANVPFPGTSTYLPSNACAGIIQEDEWEGINSSGVPSAAIHDCINRQLRP